MRETWSYIQQLRSKIGDMLEVNNEGVRFYSVKFLECIITTLTHSSPVTLQCVLVMCMFVCSNTPTQYLLFGTVYAVD